MDKQISNICIIRVEDETTLNQTIIQPTVTATGEFLLIILDILLRAKNFALNIEHSSVFSHSDGSKHPRGARVATMVMYW